MCASACGCGVLFACAQELVLRLEDAIKGEREAEALVKAAADMVKREAMSKVRAAEARANREEAEGHRRVAERLADKAEV